MCKYMSPIGQRLYKVLTGEITYYTYTRRIFANDEQLAPNFITCTKCAHSLRCLGLVQLKKWVAANLNCPCFLKNNYIEFCDSNIVYLGFRRKQQLVTDCQVLCAFKNNIKIRDIVRCCLVALKENFETLDLTETRIDEIIKTFEETVYLNASDVLWIKV